MLCASVALVACLFCALPTTAQVAPTPQEIQQAQSRWRDGKAAFDAGDFETARVAFKQAYTAYPSPPLLQNLGEAELRTARYLEAARHLSLFLSQAGTISQAQRDMVTRAVRKAAEHVGAINVAPDVTGVEIQIDGDLAGKPPLEGPPPWYVQPGDHVIRARKDGYSDVTNRITIAEGETRNCSVVMKPLTPAAAAPSQARATAPPVSKDSATNGTVFSTRTAVLAGEGLVSVVGLTIGIAYLAAASSADDAARSYQSRIDSLQLGAVCRDPAGASQGDCRELHSALSDRQRDNAVSAVGFVTAGIGLSALAMTLLFWKSPERSSPALTFDVGPSRSFASLVWKYQ